MVKVLEILQNLKGGGKAKELLVNKIVEKTISRKQSEYDEVEEARIDRTTGAIRKPPTLNERIETKGKRLVGFGSKAAVGDIPFVQKVLPKKVDEAVPRDFAEKAAFVVPRLVRDFAAFNKLEKVKLLRGTRVGNIANNFLKGSIFGAATADSEDPKEIAKRSAGTGAFFSAIPLVIKGISKAGEKAWSLLPQTTRDGIQRGARAVGLEFAKRTDVTKLVEKRYGDMSVAQLNMAKSRQAMLDGFTKEERELVPFLIEGTKVPNALNRPDLQRLMTERGEIIRKALVEKVQAHYDKTAKMFFKNTGSDIRTVENYVNRLWDIPNNKQQSVVKWFMTKNPNAQKRTVATIKEGVEKFGLKPRTLDIAELMAIYDENAIKTVANVKFLKSINKLEGRDGIKLIQSAGKAPKDWVSINNHVLNKHVAVSSNPLVIANTSAKVHPDIAKELKVIFESPTSNAGKRMLESVNAFSKHSQLSFSMFHAGALGEGVVGSGSFTPKILNPVNIIKALKKGDRSVFHRMPVARDFLSSGGQLCAVTDVQRGLVEKQLMNLETKLLQSGAIGKVGSLGVKAVRKSVELNNKFLWDYFHPMSKLNAYENWLQGALKDPRYAHLPKKMLKREIATATNDIFGGQAWGLLTKSPGWVRNMNLLLLSPDWMLSTVKQAMMPFGVGAANPITRGLRKEIGEDFWRRSIIVMYGGMNLLNRAMTEFYLGEPRWMWENEPGKKSRVFMGKNADGSNKYLRTGKQFRELPEFFVDENSGKIGLEAALKKSGGKLAPWLQQVFTQLSGGTTPSGFTTPLKRDLAESDTTVGDLAARVKQATSLVTPFSLSTSLRKEEFDPSILAFSTSKGMTPYKARVLFEKAVKRNKPKEIEALKEFALENGIDAERELKMAKRNIKRKNTVKRNQRAKKIFLKLKDKTQSERINFFFGKQFSGEDGEKLKNKVKELLNKRAASIKRAAEAKKKKLNR